MPLLKTNELRVSNAPNCESWVSDVEITVSVPHILESLGKRVATSSASGTLPAPPALSEGLHYSEGVLILQWWTNHKGNLHLPRRE